MKRALVTGGAGFIGSHLVDRLVREGVETVVLDDFSTGRRENLADAGGKIELHKADLRDAEAVREALRGCEAVFHQGALPSVARSMKDPLATTQVNVHGTLNVLQAAAAEPACRKVVFASSSSVYGDTAVLPKVETMPMSPRSPYAASKAAGEAYCVAFGHSFDLSTVCLRYFNVFGPRQSAQNQYAAVIPIFIERALRGEPPYIEGDGEQTRDFTFVSDVVEANLLAARADTGDSAVLNVAPGEPHSILELAVAISRAVGITEPPVHVDPRTGDVRHSHADASAAGGLIGWAPKVSFEDGLERTMLAAGVRSNS
ncbi:MAG: SDR family oxidoreductase [Planctomycetota bacterium]